MTKEEHELMVEMFSRLYGTIGIIEATLKSHDLRTADPKIDRALAERQARSDYQIIADRRRVKTGLTT